MESASRAKSEARRSAPSGADGDHRDAPFRERAAQWLALEVSRTQLLRELLESYDPKNEGDFSFLIESALKITGSYDRTAKMLNVGVASLHRWSKGQMMPRERTRDGVRNALVVIMRQVQAEEEKAIDAERRRMQLPAASPQALRPSGKDVLSLSRELFAGKRGVELQLPVRGVGDRPPPAFASKPRRKK